MTRGQASAFSILAMCAVIASSRAIGAADAYTGPTVYDPVPCISDADMQLAMKQIRNEDSVRGMTRDQMESESLAIGMMAAAKSPLLKRGQHVQILDDKGIFLRVQAGSRKCWVVQGAIARDD